jgi:aminoglycoside phosphotransferase (APT) family kinase protein
VPNGEFGAYEAALQGAVAVAGFPTPAVRLTSGSDSPLGRFLIVMDLLDGRPPLADLRIGRMLVDAPRLFRTLPQTLARITAGLHALDPDPVASAFDAVRAPIPRTSLDFVEMLAATARERGDDELVGAAQRLLDAPPASTRRAVCHGDLHPMNVMITPNGPALLDWTVGRVAHPAYDVAFTEMLLRNPPLPMPNALRRPIGVLCNRLAARFVREYASVIDDPASALDEHAMTWHRRMHALRALVELGGWDAAGDRPAAHPWVSFEPTARAVLGLPARVSDASRSRT